MLTAIVCVSPALPVKLSGLPVVTFRPPFVYGPNSPFYREQFFWDRLRAGRPIIIPGDGHRLVGVEQEEGEHRALAGPAQLERAACVFDLQRPEDPEPHTAPHYLAALRVSYCTSDSI